MILTIISHTPHYKSNKQIYGWGPTITEINYLSKIFTKINHIAPLYNSNPPASAKNYNSNKVVLIPIKPRGGKGLFNKIDILCGISSQLILINRYCKSSDWVQFRAPTNMGIYVLPYLRYFSKKKYWVKYAGDWNFKTPPLSYKIQRFWLKNNFNKSIVTINGKWKGQKNHILSLDNPCLSKSEISQSRSISKSKDFSGQLILCFVGLLSDKKGLEIFLKVLEDLENNNFIEMVYIVGDGPRKDFFKKRAKKLNNIKIKFTGSVIRKKLNKIYSISHIIILPSFSEGFPKVIAEAGAYGCVPVVSNVGSLGQYINEGNGILLKKNTVSDVLNAIIFLKNNRSLLKKMSLECNKSSNRFSYDNYIKSINQIIKKK